ncbi:MAG: hypothetical protein GX804_03410 [Lentisphaerae bacterium]|jgi:hypothetical protein|nr:hypothetical protein [Lentisphaerota bacterium]
MAILLFGSGCAAIKTYWEWSSYWMSVSEGRIYPKRPKFSVVPQEPSDSNGLDLDAIYYLWDTWTNRSGGIVKDCQYMRFWRSGEVYGGFVENRLPTTSDGDSLQGVRMGFYNLADSNLIVEINTPDCYIVSRGVVYTNRLVFYEYINRLPGGYSSQFNRTNTFIRLPLSGMSRQPDWSPTGMLSNAIGGSDDTER